jgi:putative membrane protein
MEAAKGGHQEVEMGRMGVEKATNPSVKQFAQRMVDDHSKANNELEALARQKGVTLPASYPKDSTESKLSKASGAGFDHEYMNAMVTDHQKDVSEFEKEASSGADPDLKSWAGKTLQTLRSHLDQAKSIKP